MSQIRTQIKREESPVDPRWKDLYRLGGISALAAIAAIAVASAAVTGSAATVTSASCSTWAFISLAMSMRYK